jgi:hypothetical protein
MNTKENQNLNLSYSLLITREHANQMPIPRAGVALTLRLGPPILPGGQLDVSSPHRQQSTERRSRAGQAVAKQHFPPIHSCAAPRRTVFHYR